MHSEVSQEVLVVKEAMRNGKTAKDILTDNMRIKGQAYYTNSLARAFRKKYSGRAWHFPPEEDLRAMHWMHTVKIGRFSPLLHFSMLDSDVAEFSSTISLSIDIPSVYYTHRFYLSSRSTITFPPVIYSFALFIIDRTFVLSSLSSI